MRRAFQYRLKTSPAVESRLEAVRDACRQLYNAALQERRDAWKRCGVRVNYITQCAQLPDIKTIRPELSSVHAQVLQHALKRLERAFENFFRRVKNGEKPGYPRFKGKDRYDSFTYPQGGWKLDGDKLILSKIGRLRVKLSRPIEGTIKTVTIKRECGKWYVIFSCEVEAQPLPATGNAIGIDLGLQYFIATSDGEVVEPPKFLRESEKKLANVQRQLAKKKPRSNRRKRAKLRVAQTHRRISNQRRDWLHKLSTRIIGENDIICFENLNIAGMVKNHHLAKSISDASWGLFVSMLVYKAEGAGRQAVDVPAPDTSQECSGCGQRVPKSLSTRWRQCPRCGLALERDHNAALNILARGLSVLASGPGVTARGGIGLLTEPANREPALGCEMIGHVSLPACF
jgi:putative transposase